MEAEHEAKLIGQTNKRIQETDEELLERRNQLAEQERSLREGENRLKSNQDELNQKIREHEINKDLLDAAKQNILNKEQSLNEKARELADAQIRELTARLDNYKQEHDRLSKERADLETQINSFNEIKTRFGGKEPEVILTEIQSLRRQVTDFERELASYPDDVLNEIAKKDTELKHLSNQRDVLNQELLDAKNDLSSREQDRLDINSLKNQNNVLKNDNERYELLVADQSKTIREFRDLYEKRPLSVTR